MLQAFCDGALFGSATGRSPAGVLALHGWARTHKDFDAVVRATDDAAALDAVAVDLPGFGASPPPPEPWGTDRYADAVVPLLEPIVEEAGRPVVVLGHSFGGRVAVQLAATRPDLVQSLVLTGVPLVRLAPPRRPARGYRLVRTLHRFGLVGDARMEAARQRYGSADYRAAQGVMRQVHVKTVAESYEAQLAAITCPVHLVWGDDDAEVPLPVARAAADRLARADLTVCPGAGHLTPLTVPGVLRATVEDARR